MKVKIHPPYHPDCKVTCACGNTFTTGSTKPTIAVEVCNQCHPYYTGEQRFVDVRGRVDTFQKKIKLATEIKKKAAGKIVKKTEKTNREAKSLRELLQEI
ncbi:50S ribosomal protein L31 [Patescibacteria group bacterium]|nr:50S ribosomal protein L31 [Patescibacteria group bacterium]MCL5091797.1 50S ribosomal protein L31 [Patescibacteria group bacterium]